MGYERAGMVTTPGEFSLRGGIIDIYPVTEEHPVRIELFDEEVDSIRYFDAETQRSLEKRKKSWSGPPTNLYQRKKKTLEGPTGLKPALEIHCKKTSQRKLKEK